MGEEPKTLPGMQLLFSTDHLPPAIAFRRWRETIRDRFVPVEQSQLGDEAFAGRMEIVNVADLSITRVFQGALHTEVTHDTIRHDERRDAFSLIIKLSGGGTISHNGHSFAHRPGDLVLLSRNDPAVLTSSPGSASYLIQIPRTRVESNLYQGSEAVTLAGIPEVGGT